MNRPDPIQYAERLYAAIRTANFSPISFLAFGNAVKDGVPMRNMPRVAAEPFMRVVGEMLDIAAEGQDTDVVEDPRALKAESRRDAATETPASALPARSATSSPAGVLSPRERDGGLHD
jgi:hypothetical protein